MVHETHIKHHQVKKKKVKKGLMKLADEFVYVGGFLALGLTIPQILKIWVEKTAAGVSLISWISYLFLAFIWIFYGVTHKEKPLVIIYILWIVSYLFVIAGIIIYG